MSEMDDYIIVKTDRTGANYVRISARALLECNMVLGKDIPPDYIPMHEKILRSQIENKMVEMVFDYLKPTGGACRAYGFDIVGVRGIKDNTLYVPMKYVTDIYNIVNHMYDLENENKELRKLLGVV